MRSLTDLRAACAQTALTIQLNLQHGRSFNPEKHFRVTPDEFLFLLTNPGLTRTSNVGWHEFLNIPLWVGGQQT